MHPLDVVFWVFFTAVAAFIGWSFIRMFVEILSDRRHTREHQRPARFADAPFPGGATGGAEADTSIGGSDYGSSITIGDLGSGASNGGDSGGSDSGGSDFSGGGGDYGGGGSSGGW